MSPENSSYQQFSTCENGYLLHPFSTAEQEGEWGCQWIGTVLQQENINDIPEEGWQMIETAQTIFQNEARLPRIPEILKICQNTARDFYNIFHNARLFCKISGLPKPEGAV